MNDDASSECDSIASHRTSSVDNLFFAVFPDSNAAKKIAALSVRLRRLHGLRGKPIAASRLHVSLYGLGFFASLPETVEKAASEFASAIRIPPFEVAFDRAMSFSHPADKPLVLVGDHDVAGLVELQSRLARAIAKKRLGRPSSRSFVPHITLLRDKEPVDEHPVEPVSWVVREFVLVRSLTGKGVYNILSRWPLQKRG